MTVVFDVIIPARYQSVRLPAKPLALIGGRPMVVHVAQAALASGAAHVWVATDDQRIASVCEQNDIGYVMTSPTHLTGTDRLCEAAHTLGLPEERIVVNVQGDEPFLQPDMIARVAHALHHDTASAVSTLAWPLTSYHDFISLHVVKVVRDQQARALYFSRAPIPFPRDAMLSGQEQLPEKMLAYGHSGIYAYTLGFLRQYAVLPPSPLEQYESLEQLRVLYHGFSIAVSLADQRVEPGIDTQEDLIRANAYVDALQR